MTCRKRRDDVETAGVSLTRDDSLHYAFDRWSKQYPQMPFERYADDAIVHGRTEREVQEVRAAIAARLKECGLELHPEKTKVLLQG